MVYNGQEIEFPAIIQTSFFKLIDQLETQARSSEPALAAYATSLLGEVNKYPGLRDGITEPERLKDYQQPINALSRILFPEVLTTNEIKILTPPFYFQPLITSQRFDNIVKASGKPFAFTMKDIDADTFYLFCCYYILGSYFRFPVVSSLPQLIEIYDQKQDYFNSYKILINGDLSEIRPTDKAVMIKQADYEHLVDNFGDMALWKKMFPPNSWIIRGINIINLVDLSLNQSESLITSNLLLKSEDSFEKIQQGIRRLLHIPELSIGTMTLENNQLVPIEKIGMYSILLHQGKSLDCDRDLCSYSQGRLMNKNEPIVITDVESFHRISQSRLSAYLLDSGCKSYLAIPILHGEEFLGFLELAAPQTHALHKGTLLLLRNVLPILALAKKRFMTEARNTIEAVIQRECTTLHPSVKWRFEEEARQFLRQKEAGGQAVFKDIVFENLYPLYGQMDIRNSSERRNKAVSADLDRQLGEVIRILKTAFRQTNLQIIEQLRQQATRFRGEVNQELSSGSEYRILNFLKTDIYPVFEHLQEIDPQLKDLIDGYRALLDPQLQTIYEERKHYDNCVDIINQRLAALLDRKQQEAQAIFPHYYERYKTDGIEYNIYIGQSVTREKTFNPLYLRNLRLWQLMVMCELENEFRSIRQELNTSIEIASLILVHNTPLSVHFRMDEKQFDVEGAYNARYEIIKKRVDKALIKGTRERITRPGSIAIIYSQEQDSSEYQTYLSYLVEKGYLKEDYEDLALEDLQGVHGLRALRAEVMYSPAITVNQLLGEIEGKTLN